jgi:tRNA G18 (ribose-2'-O)-methylase SpoU
LQGVDAHLSIPMRGPVDSLNVGVAAGILLFEAARQRATG